MKKDISAAGKRTPAYHIKPEWVRVTGVMYSLHQKAGKPPSLVVTYRGGGAHHREWICLEHEGELHQKAVWWWRQSAGIQEVPGSTSEALTLAQEGALRRPTEIAVRPWGDGRYTEVIGYAFGDATGVCPDCGHVGGGAGICPNCGHVGATIRAAA